MSAERQHGPDSPLPPVDFEAVDRALESIAPELDALRAVERLRALLTPHEARFAAGLRELRQRARGRFPGAEHALLTRKGLEQLTRSDVANARAKRFREHVAGDPVLDATCGLGGDSMALAAAGISLVAMDRDPELVRMACANLERNGLSARFVVGDAAHPPVRLPWFLADPDRRAGSGRSLDPGAWSPSLPRLLELASGVRGACLKLPPSFEASQLPGQLPAHRLQWTSALGELREVALWTGELAGDGQREVLAIDARGGQESLAGDPQQAAPASESELREAAFLADPDPALVRSGLLGRAARLCSMAPLGPRCAYLVGQASAGTALLPSWRILGWAQADERAVRRLLLEHDVGPVEVRKRGHPDPAEVLAKRFRGTGTKRGHLAFARLERGHRVFLLEPGGGSVGNRFRVGDEGLEPPTTSL